jgi:hypothetical protein
VWMLMSLSWLILRIMTIISIAPLLLFPIFVMSFLLARMIKDLFVKSAWQNNPFSSKDVSVFFSRLVIECQAYTWNKIHIILFFAGVELGSLWSETQSSATNLASQGYLKN